MRACDKKNSSSSTPDQDQEEGVFGENITSRFCDSSAFSYCSSPFKKRKKNILKTTSSNLKSPRGRGNITKYIFSVGSK